MVYVDESPNKGELHQRRLRESLASIPGFLNDGGNAHSAPFKIWQKRTEASIKALVGVNGEALRRFRRFSFCILRMGGAGGWTSRDQERYVGDLHAAQELIQDLLEELGVPESPAQPDDFWVHIHPDIASIARPKFEALQYVDSVEAAMKEVNVLVKDRFKRAGGTEDLDGASLMNNAFSPNAPVLRLDDLSTRSGRDAQLGYMQIFAGAMTGVRNPKAHENLVITPVRAIHLLFLASLLRSKLDDSL